MTNLGRQTRAVWNMLHLEGLTSNIDTSKDERPGMLTRTLAECTTIQAAATALVQPEPWDFMAVYYDAIDHFCHGFMRYHPPRMKGVAERDFELYQGVVESAYRYHDAMLEVLVDLAGPGVTVLLVSDHGFHPDALRPLHIPAGEPAGPAVQPRGHGIFLMAGPGIKADQRVYGASVLDVTPTVLAAFGLPTGEDMDGKPLLTVCETPASRSAAPLSPPRPGAWWTSTSPGQAQQPRPRTSTG